MFHIFDFWKTQIELIFNFHISFRFWSIILNLAAFYSRFEFCDAKAPQNKFTEKYSFYFGFSIENIVFFIFLAVKNQHQKQQRKISKNTLACIRYVKKIGVSICQID